MIIALAAVGAALATLVVTLLFQWIVHRSPEPDERLTKVVRDLESRMDDMVRELTGALEVSQLEGQRTRLLGELAGSIDLDEVLTRVLDAAGSIDGVDAALISLASQPGGQPIVASLGLSAEEAERQSVSGPLDGREARVITMSYDYSAEQVAADADAIRAGVAVPLPGEAAPLGFVTIFTRAAALTFSEEQVGELEELAMRAGPAIENARRFREARQLADLDALTSLHNRRYFHETLAREVARAHRYDRNLALIIFDLDDFKAINDRIGHLSGDGVLAEAAERVREVVRSADIACRVGGDEFAVILPESVLSDADQLYARLQKAVSTRPVGQAGPLTISAGVADLQPDDDAIAFFQRADHALYGAKERGKSQVVAASLLHPQPPSNMPPNIAPAPEDPPNLHSAG
ncbi:MAG TPA: sensor domain-containing diguanylate cyclase [Gaiellaceae bacterium]|nr:sensor domain-containing diguanylate cyclase [Gaiellaceae bacterium]